MGDSRHINRELMSINWNNASLVGELRSARNIHCSFYTESLIVLVQLVYSVGAQRNASSKHNSSP